MHSISGVRPTPHWHAHASWWGTASDSSGSPWEMPSHPSHRNSGFVKHLLYDVRDRTFQHLDRTMFCCMTSNIPLDHDQANKWGLASNRRMRATSIKLLVSRDVSQIFFHNAPEQSAWFSASLFFCKNKSDKAESYDSSKQTQTRRNKENHTLVHAESKNRDRNRWN